MPLLGDGFESSAIAVLILCSFWMVDGVFGLHGIIVAGYGRTELSLLNVLVTIGALATMMPILVPPYGLEGAALAVGLAYLVRNALQVAESRLITGTWGYTRDVLWLVLIAGVAAVVMGLSWLGLLPLGDVAARIGAFLAFLGIAVPGAWWLHRSGKLHLTTKR
jgi:O-antigen/teichoic acid export membrane protein